MNDNHIHPSSVRVTGFVEEIEQYTKDAERIHSHDTENIPSDDFPFSPLYEIVRDFSIAQVNPYIVSQRGGKGCLVAWTVLLDDGTSSLHCGNVRKISRDSLLCSVDCGDKIVYFDSQGRMNPSRTISSVHLIDFPESLRKTRLLF